MYYLNKYLNFATLMDKYTYIRFKARRNSFSGLTKVPIYNTFEVDYLIPLSKNSFYIAIAYLTFFYFPP